MSGMRLAGAVAAIWWVFLAVGVLVPLLPHYVSRTLAGGSAAVGLTAAVYGVAAVISRPLAAGYLRRHQPWTLMSICVAVGALALAATPLTSSLGLMWLLRFVEGLAVGAFYTAVTTAVVRETPAGRRGSVLSYFSVPLFLGSAFGPVCGDWLIRHSGQDHCWMAAGLLMALALPSSRLAAHGAAGAWESAGAAASAELTSLRRILRTVAHPSALLPAAIIVATISGWAGFQSYAPLYGPTIGLSATGRVFLAYSLVVIVIRVGGAHLFDRLPLVEPVAVGCAANVIGFVVVWAWRQPPALYLGAMLMAVAIALTYTTLLRVALVGVPADEEPAVVAAYSVSYDVGAGAGAAVLGLLVTVLGGYHVVFLGGAVAASIGLLLVARLWPRRAWYATGLAPPTRPA